MAIVLRACGYHANRQWHWATSFSWASPNNACTVTVNMAPTSHCGRAYLLSMVTGQHSSYELSCGLNHKENCGTTIILSNCWVRSIRTWHHMPYQGCTRLWELWWAKWFPHCIFKRAMFRYGGEKWRHLWQDDSRIISTFMTDPWNPSGCSYTLIVPV